MSSFQQKLALKGSETSIEHFAAVLKDVKDRGGWNTASALVRFHQQRKDMANIYLATTSLVVKLEYIVLGWTVKKSSTISNIHLLHLFGEGRNNIVLV